MDNLPQHTSGVFLLRPMVGFYSGVDIHLDKTIFTALGTTGAALTPSEFLISSTVDGTAGT